MLETDLVSVRLRLGQEGDFGVIHRFDIPCHMSDQWGYVDGASARNHLLPMSKHCFVVSALPLSEYGVELQAGGP